VATKAIGTVLGVVLLSSALSAATLEYTVAIGQGSDGIHVSAVARNLGGSQTELTFSTEALYVGSYVTNLGSNRGDLHAVDMGRWRLASSVRSISYDYDLPDVIPWQVHATYMLSGSDIAVYVDETSAVFMVPHVFIFPDRQEFSSIRITFDIPPEWRVVAPWDEVSENVYVVRHVNRELISDFKGHQIYMGRMKFYAESDANDCIVKVGKLWADDESGELMSQAETEASALAMRDSLIALENLFGRNPFSVYTLVPNFKRLLDQEWYFFSPWYLGNSLQHWPEHRRDELIGHAAMAWVGPVSVPLLGGKEFKNGMCEFYYGLLYAWELFEDPAYLAKRYLHYLAYEWMHGHHVRSPSSYACGTCDEYDVYFRWELICMLLDEEIRRRTSERHQLADAVKWLYSRFADTGYTIKASDLHTAIEAATGAQVSDLFDRYVYQDEKLPVFQYVASYREHFEAYGELFETLRHHNYMLGHTVPWFINIVMASSLAQHIPHGLGVLEYPAEFAEYVLERHEVDLLTEEDVVEALTHLTEIDCTSFFTQWEDTYGRLTIDQVRAWLRDYRDRPPAVGDSSRTGSWSVFGINPDLFAFAVDGNPEPDWINLGRRLADKAGDTDVAGADVVAVYAYSDDEYLYVRVDVADSAPDPSSIVYTIGVTALNYTPPGPGPVTLRNTTSTEAIFVSGHGSSNQIAFAAGVVVEYAFPLEWLGDCDYAKIRCETRSMDDESNTRYDFTRTFEIHFGAL